ncbi:MAG: hypothetical protein ABFD08_13695 [Syntrophomonas sp.]
MSNTLFRKASLDSISSPEQLNDYIKVSNPSVWIILAALFILLAAVLVWSLTGSLPTSIQAKGVVKDGDVLSYVDAEKAGAIKAGQTVKIQAADQKETIDGQIATVEAVPRSAAEIAKDLQSDYLVQALAPKGFAVKITISPDKADIPGGTLLNLNIVIDAVRPVDFLLK